MRRLLLILIFAGSSWAQSAACIATPTAANCISSYWEGGNVGAYQGSATAGDRPAGATMWDQIGTSPAMYVGFGYVPQTTILQSTSITDPNNGGARVGGWNRTILSCKPNNGGTPTGSGDSPGVDTYLSVCVNAGSPYGCVNPLGCSTFPNDWTNITNWGGNMHGTGSMAVPVAALPSVTGKFCYAVWVRPSTFIGDHIIGQWGNSSNATRSWQLDAGGSGFFHPVLDYATNNSGTVTTNSTNDTRTTTSSGTLVLLWMAYDPTAGASGSIEVSSDAQNWQIVALSNPFVLPTNPLDFGQEYGTVFPAGSASGNNNIGPTIGRAMFWNGYIPTNAEISAIYNAGAGEPLSYYTPVDGTTPATYTMPTFKTTVSLANSALLLDANLPNSACNVAPYAVTFNSSATVSSTQYNLLASGQTVTLGGSPPLPFITGTTYYVIATGLTNTTAELSLTLGGSAVVALSSGSATLTIVGTYCEGLYWLRPYPLYIWNPTAAAAKGNYVWMRSQDHTQTTPPDGMYIGYSASASVPPTSWTVILTSARLNADYGTPAHWSQAANPHMMLNPDDGLIYIYGDWLVASGQTGPGYTNVEQTFVYSTPDTDPANLTYVGAVFPATTTAAGSVNITCSVTNGSALITCGSTNLASAGVAVSQVVTSAVFPNNSSAGTIVSSIGSGSCGATGVSQACLSHNATTNASSVLLYFGGCATNYTGYAVVRWISTGNFAAETLATDNGNTCQANLYVTWTGTTPYTWAPPIETNQANIRFPYADQNDQGLGPSPPSAFNQGLIDPLYMGAKYFFSAYYPPYSSFQLTYPYDQLFAPILLGGNSNGWWMQDTRYFVDQGTMYLYVKEGFKQPSATMLYTGTYPAGMSSGLFPLPVPIIQ